MKIIGIVVLVVTVGCGGSDDTEPPIQQPDVDKGAADAENYDIAYTVCGGVLNGTINPDPSNSADPETNPAAFADGYADGYEDAYRQAAFDGCLDALEGREKDPPD
jgi:hypothetical protein